MRILIVDGTDEVKSDLETLILSLGSKLKEIKGPKTKRSITYEVKDLDPDEFTCHFNNSSNRYSCENPRDDILHITPLIMEREVSSTTIPTPYFEISVDYDMDEYFKNFLKWQRRKYLSFDNRFMVFKRHDEAPKIEKLLSAWELYNNIFIQENILQNEYGLFSQGTKLFLREKENTKHVSS